ncbi:uncharacterized protein LOC134534120 [Bacillus rossius redtenbacheri]|uniref:uncharacterized protein LOC134534120 n=1 Tax=Bacillus rossius redtenbacheri TaxID=93214 RepID=UPI002FDD5BA0
MVRVLDGYTGEFAATYLDDVIIWSRLWDDQARHLGQVLEGLARHCLTCAPQKCHVGAAELEYLGHIVDAEGFRSLPKHLNLIESKPTPRTRTQLQKLMDLLNWLRSLIPHFASITAPMMDLLSPKLRFQWTSGADAALDAVGDKGVCRVVEYASAKFG